MKNQEIAKIFRAIANILEIKGENVFRINAYNRAAQNIELLSQDIETLTKENRLDQIPGVGHDLKARITEYITNGKIEFFEELKKSIPEGLLELLDIPSIGPKTAKLLYEKLKIKNIADLENAIKKNKLKQLAGIKEKTISNIQKGIDIVKKGSQRMTIAQAEMVASEFLNSLQSLPEIKKIIPAGSLRRQKDTVRDIDILVCSDNPNKVIKTFTGLENVKDVLAHGQTKSSVRTKENIQVDCRIVPDESFGAALLYFTGSKDFNIKLRQIAIKKGLKLNEYGLFKDDKRIAGKTEEEMLKNLGLSYIEPELRENTGEIELAKKNDLPDLIKLSDIKGDLHVHSNWSDGGNSILEMAKASEALGYSYIAVTDHSQSLKVAGGLSLSELKEKKKELDKANKQLNNFRIFFGTEVDIDSNGKIDYPNSVLKQFDIVIAAIHTGFKQNKLQITKRIIKACQNKYVNIIAHPTGKLWGVRDAYDIDFEEIIKVAKDTNTALEISSFPQRLDLNDIHTRLAKEAQVKLSINTDSHSINQLISMKYGISVARRAWLNKTDVINTLAYDKLLEFIRK